MLSDALWSVKFHSLIRAVVLEILGVAVYILSTRAHPIFSHVCCN